MQKIYFDIGGTNIEYSIVGSKNNEIKKFSVNQMNKDQLLKKIAEIIDGLNDDVWIGISSPTGVNSKTGYCEGFSGIKDYGNFNLYEELKVQIVKSKIIYIQAVNDGNAALLGIINEEFKLNKPSSAVMISLGTGIGGAIYIDGKLFSGINNLAGEFGYPIWDNDMNISQVLSPVNNFRRFDNKKSGIEIIDMYETEKFKLQIDNWLEGLSKLISIISFFINPEVIVFNGGVVKNIKFQNLLMKSYKEYLLTKKLGNLSKTKINFFTSNKNYSLLGAKSLIDHDEN